MSGIIPSTSLIHNKFSTPEYRKSILSDLLLITKECQTHYGGKTELATENDLRILKLCDRWEVVLSHGLITSTSSVLKNVADMVSGALVELPNFWEFAFKHMTRHEKERYSTLRNVWTDRGKTRALIRASLNERSLERYIQGWLGVPDLNKSYENWALMRDEEAVNLLPSMAGGLSSILFAISIDTPDLNVVKVVKDVKPEPVIAAPIPVKSSNKRNSNSKRQIIEFDNNGMAVTPPKELLSTLCLKQDDSGPSPVLAHRSNVYNVHEELPSIVQNVSINVESLETSTSNSMSASTSDKILTPPTDSGIDNPFQEIERESPLPQSLPSKRSSLHSSSISLSSSSENPDEENQMLRKRLRETEERCHWLEERVAHLSLENHKLRGLSNSPRGGLTYFVVSVPRAILVKKFYVYEIHITPAHGGDEWTVKKRYSDFYNLHQSFQYTNPSVSALDFPPKKKFGNMDACFVEQRRQRLQVYLRHLLAILPEVATCNTRVQLEQAFPFFK